MLTRMTACFALLLSACVLASAQTTYPGAVDTAVSLGRATDHAETTLTVAAIAGDTVITVANGLLFEVGDIVTFCVPVVGPPASCTDSGEKARVSGVSSTTITLSARNVDGTTAQAHAIGDLVHCTINSTYPNFALGAIEAIEAKVDTLGTGSGYATVQDGGVSATQRSILNLIPGGGITLACPDNSGAGSTDCTISAPGATGTGTNWQTLEVGGVSQTASPTENLIAGTGITIAGVHNGGTNAADITISATGSGAGTKTAYAVFPAAGCTGSSIGSAIDLPATGGPTPINHNGSTLILCTDDFTSGTNQSAQISFPLPGDWTASSTVGLQLNWFSSVGSGSTVWTAKTICVPSTSTVLTGTIAWNATSTVTTANPVTPVTRTASVFSGIAATGCFAGGEMWIHIQRTDSATGVVSLKSASVAIQRTY